MRSYRVGFNVPVCKLTTMKLYEFHETKGIDSLTLIEREAPKPKHGEVLIRVHAVSLNYRDLLIADSKYSRGLKLPLIPISPAVAVRCSRC